MDSSPTGPHPTISILLKGSKRNQIYQLIPFKVISQSTGSHGQCDDHADLPILVLKNTSNAPSYVMTVTLLGHQKSISAAAGIPMPPWTPRHLHGRDSPRCFGIASPRGGISPFGEVWINIINIYRNISWNIYGIYMEYISKYHGIYRTYIIRIDHLDISSIYLDMISLSGNAEDKAPKSSYVQGHMINHFSFGVPELQTIQNDLKWDAFYPKRCTT